jgi:hypothetical protein
MAINNTAAGCWLLALKYRVCITKYRRTGRARSIYLPPWKHDLSCSTLTGNQVEDGPRARHEQGVRWTQREKWIWPVDPWKAGPSTRIGGPPSATAPSFTAVGAPRPIGMDPLVLLATGQQRSPRLDVLSINLGRGGGATQEGRIRRSCGGVEWPSLALLLSQPSFNYRAPRRQARSSLDDPVSCQRGQPILFYKKRHIFTNLEIFKDIMSVR